MRGWIEASVGSIQASCGFMARGRGFPQPLLWPGPGLKHPWVAPREKLRTFNQVQEPAFPHEPVEVAEVVSPEVLVLEVDPEPRPGTTVVDIEGAGLRISGD